MVAIFPLNGYAIQVRMHQNVTIMGATVCGTSEYVSLSSYFLNKTYLKSSLFINMVVGISKFAHTCPYTAVTE